MKYNNLRFIDYNNTTINNEYINNLYSINNIKYDKWLLYQDYTISLFYLIVNTYMGDENYSDNNDFIKHFNWCWDKNNYNFKEEGVSFSGNKKLYDYFMELTFIYFYNVDKKDLTYDDKKHKIIDIWLDIFNHKNIKTKYDLDNLIELYNIFNS